jgi:glycosyltransferase involved in cell wall biosynthesis
MIVKNEAHIICRCLQSCLPLLDYVLIVDTGSNDGTQQVIRNFLMENSLPGEVLEEPWQNFAYNRSFAMAKLREHADIDYGLMIDADELLIFDEEFDVGTFKQQLGMDLYNVESRYASISYVRPQLFSNRLPFYYKGVVHEFLEIDQTVERETVKGFYNNPVQDSARSLNPRKFLDDADLLAKALREETDEMLVSRYTFYLAQCYRDGGELRLSLDAYLRRSSQGGWVEEVYFSLLSAARLKENLAYTDDEVIQSYLAANEVLPVRLEALHDAIRYCRLHDKFQQGYMLAKHALTQPTVRDGLFVEYWISDYGILDEFSIVAYWSGHYRECLDVCIILLEQGKMPAHYQQRVRENAGFAIQQLGQPELADLLPVD